MEKQGNAGTRENVDRYPKLKLILKFLAGPACFWLIRSAGAGVFTPEANNVLGTLCWAIAWWVLQPIPWAITALLPLIVFPLSQTMTIKETAALYGQRIFFWIWALSLFAQAVQKQGLAKRFTLLFLSLPGVASSTYRLLFFYMLATGFVSWFVSDASAIAFMMPLGLALHSHIQTLIGDASESPVSELDEDARNSLATFFGLGTLYAAVSGGVATIAGMPHNAAALAQFEAITNNTIGWFQWMGMGVPIFLTCVVLLFLLLCLFFPVKINKIPGGKALIRQEKEKLGKMTLGEKHVLFAFSLLAALFTLPALAPTFLGEAHSISLWLDKVYSTWIVPPTIAILLFCLPTNTRKKEFVLNWKETVSRTPWHTIFLVTSAVGMTSALQEFGFVDVAIQYFKTADLSPTALPFFAGGITFLSTNFFSGVAAATLFTGMMIPVAQAMGVDPVGLTILIPVNAMGIALPWAGPTTATAFGFGGIGIKDLFKVGIVAQMIVLCVSSIYCLIFYG